MIAAWKRWPGDKWRIAFVGPSGAPVEMVTACISQRHAQDAARRQAALARRIAAMEGR